MRFSCFLLAASFLFVWSAAGASTSRLPLVFERLDGQLFAHAGSTTLLLGPDSIRFIEPGRNSIEMHWIGGDPSAAPVVLNPLASYSNYYRGNDAKQWLTHVPHFGVVKYRDVYPGIDLVFHGGNQHQLEYDFVLAPNADPNRITLSFTGAEKVSIDNNGDLVLKTPQGELRQQAPVLYQDIDGHRQSVSGHYVQKPNHRIGFQTAAYDHTKPLTIDPILTYSTFLGGSAKSAATGVAVDGNGNMYLAGVTNSVDFPVTPNAVVKSIYSDYTYNAFLAKLSPDGGALLYSTYFGDISRDWAMAIVADANGNLYAAGTASSQNFPTTPHAYKTPSQTIQLDTFVLKLDPTGQLIYSTVITGNSTYTEPKALAVSAAGVAYVTGDTVSAAIGDAAFPTTPGAYQTQSAGSYDAFVTAVNPTGTGVLYSTLLGGSGNDFARALVVDSKGNATIVGDTTWNLYHNPPATSSDFPTTAGVVQPQSTDPYNAFVTQLNATGTALVFSTLLGGKLNDVAYGIATDPSGNFYVTGSTSSTDFPTTPGAYQSTPGGGFVTKLNSRASALLYSTYFNLGGSSPNCYVTNADKPCEAGSAIAVDPQELAYVVGTTSNPAFPTTTGALQRVLPENSVYQATTYFQQAFLLRLNAAGSALDYSTLFGGSSPQTGDAVAVDGSGNVLIGGLTTAPNMPTTANAIQTTYTSPSTSQSQAYLAKISMQPGSCSVSVSTQPLSFPAAGVSGTLSVTAPPGCPWSAYTIPLPNSTVAPVLKFNPAGSGVGNGILNYTATLNYSSYPRTGDLMVAGNAIPISQDALPCTYRLDSSGVTTFATELIQAIQVYAPLGCSWTPISNASWLTVRSSGASYGDNLFTIDIAANTGPPRTGTISIAGLTYTVLQAGGPGVCSISFSPNPVSISSSATTGTINVTTPSQCPWPIVSSASWLTATGTPTFGSGALTYSATVNTGAARSAVLSVGNSTITVNQNAPGGVSTLATDIGIFRSSGNGGVLWVRDRNGDGVFTGGVDTAVTLGAIGTGGDLPLIGDWNGSGTKKLGVYRPATSSVAGQGLFVLDYNGDEQYTTGVDKAFWFQPLAGDVPVVGKWNGGTKDQIGIFRSGVWYLDINGDGTFAKTIVLGQAGDIPVVGDWNGSGTTKVGVFRHGLWILDYNGNGQWDGPSIDKFFYLGQGGDAPIAGDWNGSGTAKAGIYRSGLWVLDYNGNGQWDGMGTDKALFNGTTGDTPVLGDWTGDGKLKAGVFHQGTFFLDVLGDGSFSRLAFIGQAGDTPIAGKF